MLLAQAGMLPAWLCVARLPVEIPSGCDLKMATFHL